MSNDPMNIGGSFRAQELVRRAARREHLRLELLSITKRMANEGMLLTEELSPEDIVKHEQAVDLIKLQSVQFESDLVGGYWRRLWNALINKKF